MTSTRITGATPLSRTGPRGSKSSTMRRSWSVLTVFVGIVCLQLLVTVLSIEVMASVRAYVSGESLYSKAQKDAQIHLITYAEMRDERDYALFMKSLAIPLGDRFAREEMQKADFDEDAARRGYLAGGNHPEDIPGAIAVE